MRIYENWSEEDERYFQTLEAWVDKQEAWVRKWITAKDAAIDQFRDIELLTRPVEDLISLTEEIASYEQ